MAILKGAKSKSVAAVTTAEIAGAWGNIDEPSGGKPIPKDTYDLTIDEATVEHAKESGNAYVNLTVTVVDGDYAGRKVWEKLFLGTVKANGEPSQALSMTKKLLGNIFNGSFPSEYEGLSDKAVADTEALALLVAGSLTPGTVFRAGVRIEKSDNEEFPDKNRLRALG